jgi:hypothetical protein
MIYCNRIKSAKDGVSPDCVSEENTPVLIGMQERKKLRVRMETWRVHL